MDSNRPNRADATPPGGRPHVAGAPSAEATAFIRFCYRRRRTGWPELYDEMCAVASRRLYNGWGFQELADVGIGFSLFETPTLAAIARQIVTEEAERRARGAAAQAAAVADGVPVPAETADMTEKTPVPLRLAGVVAT
jgi:hypothetical protein